MCTQVNMSDLITIHHEMGHIQYYMHYSVQPVPFRYVCTFSYNHKVVEEMERIPDSMKRLAIQLHLPLPHRHIYRKSICWTITRAIMIRIWTIYSVRRWARYHFFHLAIWLICFDGMCLMVRSLPINTTLDGGLWEQNIKVVPLLLMIIYHRWFLGIVPPNARPSNYFDPGSKSHIDGYYALYSTSSH
jgi:hypothetical protein